MRLVGDEKLLAYVNAIGENLIRHLPDTGLKFTFHLMDIPQVNAFNIPGGHVFVSRKLVAYVNNEDELAGVIAHELDMRRYITAHWICRTICVGH